MPTFTYQGRTQAGEKIAGSYDADKIADVVSFLHERGVTPLNIEPKKKEISKGSWNITLFGGNVKPQDIQHFAQQMTTLVSAGVPLLKAIKQLARTSKKPLLRETLNSVANSIDAGKSLATSLKEYPKIFPSVFVSLVEIGENTGHLEDAFLELSNILEKRIVNRRRLIVAVRYPLIVVTAVMIAMLAMNFFVVPKFARLFTQTHLVLPWPTKVLIALSTFMQNNWILILIGLVVLIVAVRFLLTIPKIRMSWDKNKLRFPIIGDLSRRIILTQFTWTFGLILRSGISVVKGLVLTAGIGNNVYIEQEILKIRDLVESGENFSRAVASCTLFDADAVQMIAVGEESGKLDEMLTKVAMAYDADLEYDIKNLNTLLEPLILGIVAIMVAILALAVYLPIWDMINIAHR